MSTFALHQRLAEDTLAVVSLALCDVRLMNDNRFAWLILVPRLPDLRELHDVPPQRRAGLFDEIEAASLALQRTADPFKLNVGALGNLVPQLHIHVIARHPDDAAWPGPVWGNGQPVAYARDAAEQLISDLRDAFG